MDQSKQTYNWVSVTQINTINVASKSLSFRFRVWEVPDSNLGPEIVVLSNGFPQFLHANGFAIY